MSGTLQSNLAGAVLIVLIGAVIVAIAIWYSRRDRL